MDTASTMEDGANLSQRIAGRVRELRAARSLSLEGLASRTGVARAMISLMGRGESAPPAVVLKKLAPGWGVLRVSLFDPPVAAGGSGPVARGEDQPEWRAPASGYVRRNVSPPGLQQPMQI